MGRTAGCSFYQTPKVIRNTDKRFDLPGVPGTAVVLDYLAPGLVQGVPARSEGEPQEICGVGGNTHFAGVKSQVELPEFVEYFCQEI